MSQLNQYVKTTVMKPVRMSLEIFTRTFPGPYIIEPKLDGERAMVFATDGKIIIANKGSTVYSPEVYPNLIKNIKDGLKMDDVVLDCELHTGGRFYSSNFLSERTKDNSVLKITAFDITHYNSLGDITHLALRERKKFLEYAVPNHVIGFTWAESAEEIEERFNQYVEQGYEGIVVKAFPALSEQYPY